MFDAFSLQDRVAIITGGAAGIGHAIARTFSAAGARIALVDKDHSVADRAAALGSDARGYRFDLSQLDRLPELVAQIRDDFSQIDILVNNAGIGILEPVGEVQLASWQSTLQINLSASFFLAQLCGREMVARGYGRIVSVASQASVVALNDHAAYCVSKAGIVAFTQVIAAEWGPYGVTANAVSPTVVETELGKRYWHGERAERMKAKIPSRRFASEEEIASAVLFLSSREAAMINGENLLVDGGYSKI